jgi:hypothetical protein
MAKQTHMLKAACNIDSLNHNCLQIHRFHVQVQIHALLIVQKAAANAVVCLAIAQCFEF